MIKVKYGDIQFALIDRWNELSLAKFIELAEIEIPEKLVSMYLLSAKMSISNDVNLVKEWNFLNESITFEDNFKNFPDYYGKVIKVLSNATDEMIDKVYSEQREQIFNTSLKGFVLSLLYMNPVDMTSSGEVKPYVPVSFDSFFLDDNEFQFPKTLTIMGEKVRFAREPIMSFAEACDIDIANNALAADGIKKLPLFMSVYCRRNNESYNELRTLERIPLFEKCTMDIVWSLFFYIGSSLTKFMIDTVLSLKVQEKSQALELISE